MGEPQMTPMSDLIKRKKLLRDVTSMLNSLDFYRQRFDLLQAHQHLMRDPERTLVCDILANGQLFPDPAGTRYPTETAP
jgi:hypothetical protein